MTNAPTNEVKTILDKRLLVSKAIAALSVHQFTTYLTNKNDVQGCVHRGINNKILQAIFTRFRALNIPTNHPLSDAYSQKVGTYYWGAFLGTV